MQQVTGENTASSYARVGLCWTLREISSQKGWLKLEWAAQRGIRITTPGGVQGKTKGGSHCSHCLGDTVFFSHRLDSDLRDLFQSNSFCNSLCKGRVCWRSPWKLVTKLESLSWTSIYGTPYIHIYTLVKTCRKENKHHILHYEKVESTQKLNIRIVILAFQLILF